MSRRFDDPTIPGRIRARDRDVLQEVVQAYLPQVLRTAQGAGLTPQQAEDVAQETRRTGVESAPRFEGRSHVRTWIFGILYRKQAEARRGFARDREFDDIDEVFESRFNEQGGWSHPPEATDSRL